MKGNNMITVQPIVNTAYTEKGHKYTESNAGKYGAAATVGAGATVVAFKAAKEIPFNKVKNINFEKIKHIDFSKIKKIKNVKIKMPNFKQSLQNVFAGIEKFAVKAQVKLGTAKIKKPEFGKIFKKPSGLKAIKEGFSRIAGKARILSNKAMAFVNKNTVKAAKAGKYAGFVAGAAATGVAIDYVFNKISAYKADKQ